MSHNDPHPIFVKPCKDAIKAALVLAGIGELDISYSSIERNGATGARILSSQKIPPVMNMAGDPPNGGVRSSWRGDDGQLRVRSKRFDLILHFDVTMWSEKLSEATQFFFDFARHLPRSITDAMPASGLAVQPADEHGMPILLTMLMPILPDDTTNTAKQYKATCVVRADGGLWLDKQATVAVTPVITVSSTLLP